VLEIIDEYEDNNIGIISLQRVAWISTYFNIPVQSSFQHTNGFDCPGHPWPARNC
jgi:hypothetical protein